MRPILLALILGLLASGMLLSWLVTLSKDWAVSLSEKAFSAILATAFTIGFILVFKKYREEFSKHYPAIPSEAYTLQTVAGETRR